MTTCWRKGPAISVTIFSRRAISSRPSSLCWSVVTGHALPVLGDDHALLERVQLAIREQWLRDRCTDRGVVPGIDRSKRVVGAEPAIVERDEVITARRQLLLPGNVVGGGDVTQRLRTAQLTGSGGSAAQIVEIGDEERIVGTFGLSDELTLGLISEAGDDDVQVVLESHFDRPPHGQVERFRRALCRRRVGRGLLSLLSLLSLSSRLGGRHGTYFRRGLLRSYGRDGKEHGEDNAKV